MNDLMSPLGNTLYGKPLGINNRIELGYEWLLLLSEAKLCQSFAHLCAGAR